MKTENIAKDSQAVIEFAPKITMKPIQPPAFQSGVFLSEGSLLAPVVFSPRSFCLDADFQSLQEVCGLRQRALQHWWSLAGPACVGQYSLLSQRTVSVLARCDFFLRSATSDEAKFDFDNFGEQVALKTKEDDPENKDHRPVIPFFSTVFYYTGPPRLVTVVFWARVIETPVSAENIASLICEVDELAAKTKMAGQVATEGYFLLQSVKGTMRVLSFVDAAEVDFAKERFLGEMKMERDRLLFLPEGEKNSPIDFTVNKWRG